MENKLREELAEKIYLWLNTNGKIIHPLYKEDVFGHDMTIDADKVKYALADFITSPSCLKLLAHLYEVNHIEFSKLLIKLFKIRKEKGYVDPFDVSKALTQSSIIKVKDSQDET